MKNPYGRPDPPDGMAPPSTWLSRRDILRLGAGGLAGGLAGCLSGADPAEPTPTPTATQGRELTMAPDPEPSSAWREVSLTDVRTEERFTVSQFAGQPVLLETFAVWCPTCTRQQRQLRSLLDQRADVVAITLDVDPNEDAARVREHLAKHEAFDWRYAVSPPEMTRSLVDTFGTVMTTPPAAPVVRICPDGTATRLSERGVKSADTLLESLEQC